MRVVVTGAAGFIGSHVTDALLARGDGVVGVDSFAANYDRSLKEGNLASASSHAAFELIEEDLAESDLERLLAGSDALVHLAALTDARAGHELTAEYERINVDLPRRLIESAASCGVGSIVLASSSAVYGGARSDGTPSSETDPYRPIGLYGESKVWMEESAARAVERMPAPVVSLRLFTVYGSRQRPDMLCARAIAAATGGPPLQLLGDGSQRRAWVHVSDVAAAVLSTIDSNLAPGSVINIGSDETNAVSDLIREISRLADSEVEVEQLPAHPADPAATIADISLARDMLGWTPRVSLTEGLGEQIAPTRAPAR